MQKIRILVMDVDGTLTDGKIYMGDNGEVMKVFDIKDGCGIHDVLLPSGIIPVIITGRSSKILENRCKEIGIENLYQGVSDKAIVLKDVVENMSTNLSEVAYIGDDINDLLCMQIVKDSGGIVGCPFDAVKEVKKKADYVCNKKGGAGAVREFIEYICYNAEL